MARHQHLAAAANRFVGEGVAVIAEPTNIISTFDRFAQAAETFFLYRQQEIARIFPSVQPGRIYCCGVESALSRKPGFLGSVINRAEENVRINRFASYLFAPKVVQAIF